MQALMKLLCTSPICRGIDKSGDVSFVKMQQIKPLFAVDCPWKGPAQTCTAGCHRGIDKSGELSSVKMK